MRTNSKGLFTLAVLLSLATLWVTLACHASRDPAIPGGPRFSLAPWNSELQSCAECHPKTVEHWRHHGMAASFGPIQSAPLLAAMEDRWHPNSETGYGWRIEQAQDASFHVVRQDFDFPPSAERRRSLPLIAQIGAGVHDVSYVAREGELWRFAPVERLPQFGFALAPFQTHGSQAGLNQPLTSDCLNCHLSKPIPQSYPADALGKSLPASGLNCSACHGSGKRHIQLMRQEDGSLESGILNPSDWEPQRQLDLCARCHLQGDARIPLQPGREDPYLPGQDLLASRAVFVAANPNQDFGFVSQANRLALSSCFRKSKSMTCSSCHDPHKNPRAEGRASFLQKCLSCHSKAHPDQVRKEQDCISCHMPSGQPFDLEHVDSVDHWIRVLNAPLLSASRRPGSRPTETLDQQALARFRWRAEDSIPQSSREQTALLATALHALGRSSEASSLWQQLPKPGSAGATSVQAKENQTAVLSLARVHAARALDLEKQGHIQQALLAWEDALRVEPLDPESHMNRARLLAHAGRVPEALQEAEWVAAAYPLASTPWRLRANLATQAKEWAMALTATQEAIRRQPASSDLHSLRAMLLQKLGQAQTAKTAQQEATRLLPPKPSHRHP